MTNTPPTSRPRLKPTTIANMNAEAKRIEIMIKKNANAERARQAKRAATLTKRQGQIEAHRSKIGTMVRKTYLTNNQIARLVSGHLSPANARAAGIAFMSPSFIRAARNKAAQLKVKVERYRNLWGTWYKGLTPEQRLSLSRNMATTIHGNTNLKYYENPMFFAKKALAIRPPHPELTNAQSELIGNAFKKASKIHKYTWKGANKSLHNLAKPEVNAILRRYGLPFSMTQARNNLYNRKGLTAAYIAQLQHGLQTGKKNQRSYKNVPFAMSLAHAAGTLPRPPKGLKGYAGKRVRRNYRYRVEYL